MILRKSTKTIIFINFAIKKLLFIIFYEGFLILLINKNKINIKKYLYDYGDKF